MRRLLILLLAGILLFSGCARREAEPTGPFALGKIIAPPENWEELTGTGEDQSFTWTLVVPEGYTLARIGMVLEDEGICTVEEFIEISRSADFSLYPLVAAQQPDARRCYPLEGYLFPATYEIYRNEAPEMIIHRMLSHMEERITQELREQVAASGYTFDEILTMASIIEKEAFGQEQMPLISSVLHNRLDQGMRLECDVTITYVEGAIKPFITEGDENFYNEFYNTYKCAALPAGAICNPGLPAIQAAVSPANTNYLFFVTDEEQNYLYAETYEEHLVNVEAAGIG